MPCEERKLVHTTEYFCFGLIALTIESISKISDCFQSQGRPLSTWDIWLDLDVCRLCLSFSHEPGGSSGGFVTGRPALDADACSGLSAPSRSSAETVPAPVVHQCRRRPQGLSHAAHAAGRRDELWAWDGRFSQRVSLVSRVSGMNLCSASSQHFPWFAVNRCSASYFIAMFVGYRILATELNV